MPTFDRLAQFGEGASRGLLLGILRQKQDEKDAAAIARADQIRAEDRQSRLADIASERDYRSSERAADRGFQRSERIAGQDFTAEQSAEDRAARKEHDDLARSFQEKYDVPRQNLEALGSLATSLEDLGDEDWIKALNGARAQLAPNLPEITTRKQQGDYTIIEYGDGSATKLNRKTGVSEQIKGPTPGGKNGKGANGEGEKPSDLIAYIKAKVEPYKIDSDALERIVEAQAAGLPITSEMKAALVASKKNAFQRLDEAIDRGDQDAKRVKAQIEEAYRKLDAAVGIGSGQQGATPAVPAPATPGAPGGAGQTPKYRYDPTQRRLVEVPAQQ